MVFFYTVSTSWFTMIKCNAKTAFKNKIVSWWDENWLEENLKVDQCLYFLFSQHPSPRYVCLHHLPAIPVRRNVFALIKYRRFVHLLIVVAIFSTLPHTKIDIQASMFYFKRQKRQQYWTNSFLIIFCKKKFFFLWHIHNGNEKQLINCAKFIIRFKLPAFIILHLYMHMYIYLYTYIHIHMHMHMHMHIKMRYDKSL